MIRYLRCIVGGSIILALSASFTGFAACSSMPSRSGRQSVYIISGSAFTSPVKVDGADYFLDGGSIAITLTDAGGRELRLVSDMAFERASSDAELERKLKDCCRFYVGGFPGMAGASLMERGGKDELEVQRLLNDCIETDGAGGPQFEPTVASFLERLDKEIQLHSARNSPPRGRAN